MNNFSTIGCAEWTMVDGQVVLSELAMVSVFDRGFLYGDAIFETLAVYEGELFLVGEHWQRLVRSAESLYLRLPFYAEKDFISRCIEIVSANKMSNAILRITVSRGVGPRGLGIHACSSPSYVIACYPRSEIPVELQNVGKKLHIANVKRVAPDMLPTASKIANYLNNILAYTEAMNAGADDALLLSADGYIAECTSSNIFFVINNILKTPALDTGALSGVTRKIILEIANRLGLETSEHEHIKPNQIPEATEVFMSNTVTGPMPVCAIDHLKFSTFGQITKAIRREYEILPFSERL